MLLVSRSATPYHHGDLAAALETAARELLETRSHADLSLREVARQAGVSHNAPYHHYGDRAGLLKSLAARAMAELVEAQHRAAATVAEPHERLQAVGLAYVGYAVDHSHAFALIYDPEVCAPGDPSAAMAEHIDANHRLLDDLVAELWPDVDDAGRAARAAGLWSTVHGLAQLVTAGHLSREVVGPALEALVTAPPALQVRSSG